MVLARDFKETVRERVERDAAFREALFTEGIECLLAGDVDTGEAVFTLMWSRITDPPLTTVP